MKYLKNVKKFLFRSANLLFFLVIFACLTSFKAATGSKNYIVVIDPGHPSEISSGKTIQNGISEVEANWKTALALEKFLKKRPGITVLKTKEKLNQLTTNRERAEFGNKHKADLMVRLHCDSGKGNGFTVYYPDKQGKHEGKIGPSQDVIYRSGILAKCIHSALREVLGTTLRDNGIKGDSTTAVGSKLGALIGSIYSEIPVVTVEMVFLSDEFDAKFIKSPAGRELMAYALDLGIAKFLGLQK